MSCAEIKTVDEVEALLDDGFELVVAEGPPFCGDLEEHFLRGLYERVLSNEPVGLLLERGGDRFSGHRTTSLPVWVNCDELVVRRDGWVAPGVVCGDHLLSGCMARAFSVHGKDRFLLGRISYPVNPGFEDWMAEQGVIRSTIVGDRTRSFRGGWFRDRLKFELPKLNGLSVPKRAQRGAGPSLRNGN